VTALEWLFWVSALLCVYPYLGYPLLLWIVATVWRRPILKADIAPTVSVIIAAYNEERQIAAKIENTLALDYPRDRLQIIVASDGSADATEAITARYSQRGVELVRLPRSGKLRTLNQAVARATGEILVLTDANAELQADALKRLVAPFADRDVGGVCGNQQYLANVAGDSVGASEQAYWEYDKALKKLETAIGSTIAADGSLYALRRELYVMMDDGAQADDFAISARVVTVGRKRLVYEPDAVSFEPRPLASGLEFWRKVRIANHSLRSVFSLERGLNPFASGFYAVELWSHKVLRYAAPLFALAALGASAALARSAGFYALILAVQLSFYALAFAGLAWRRSRPRVVALPFHFCLANAAVIVGMMSVLRGERIAAWQPQRDH
jgi:cellulose synthase/poly-beta-1,6-N-acetylglucosamine synthase-like glycosyltransferase